MSVEQHIEAIQTELLGLQNQMMMGKNQLEKAKQELAAQRKQHETTTENFNNMMIETAKNKIICERTFTVISQYQSLIPPEAAIVIQQELEKHKATEAASANVATSQMMGGMMGMNPMNAMIMAQAQQQAQAQAAQAQAARGMMSGLTPSPRIPKQNGLPAMHGMPNGMALAMQNPMMAAMAANPHLQAMGMAFSGMPGMGMPGMPPFNPQQMAAMQGMAMNGLNPMQALMPMSAPSSVAAIPSHMNLAVSTPSRNPSNGPLSGPRTPQSQLQTLNSPRPATSVKESPPTPTLSASQMSEDKSSITAVSEDTVAVA